MKTKFFLLVLCLSFVLLTAVSGTILVQKGMCQWSGIGSTKIGYSGQGYYVAGALLNRSGDASSYGTGGSQANIAAGVLAHRAGYTSTYPLGPNNLYSSWGMRTAEYYFHDFFRNPIEGLGDYMNYMQGLQFRGAGSSIIAITDFGFPTSYDFSRLNMRSPQHTKFEPLNLYGPSWDLWKNLPDPSWPPLPPSFPLYPSYF
jgi:hypothetical protein